MIESLALIFLAGLAASALCRKLKIPPVSGMLLTGIVLGPYVLNLLSPSILAVSTDLRQLALIIILLKAGLSLNLRDLKKVGRPALLMSCVPATFEIAATTFFAPVFLGLSGIEGAVMGAVLGAVSPAIVVPRMVHLLEQGYGTGKSIPQLIMAGASCDDVFVIVLFSTFTGMAQGGSAGLKDFASIPVSIILGTGLGAFTGFILGLFFEEAHKRGHSIRNSVKIIVILGAAFLLVSLETRLKNRIPLSGLLAVVSTAAVHKMKSRDFVSKRLSEKFGKLWLAAEVILFVLVGAAVDIRYTAEAGGGAVALIFAVLVFRSLGVLVCLLGTALNRRERLFCLIAYLPKATVQAAIGSVPLSMGLPCGKTVLSVAVLAILITAPLGAWGMDATYKRLLTREERSGEK